MLALNALLVVLALLLLLPLLLLLLLLGVLLLVLVVPHWRLRLWQRPASGQLPALHEFQ